MNIIVAGDYCPVNRIAYQIDNQYNIIDNYLLSYIEKSDYSVLNLECPIVDDFDKPIRKCGPHLKCRKKDVDYIKKSHFKCVTLANNHILDFGEQALKRTINYLDEIGIDHIGAGLFSQENFSHVIIAKEGQRVAICNFCEREFSVSSNNNDWGANPIDFGRMYRLVKSLKNKCDYIVFIIHGGLEYLQLPSPNMKQNYHMLIDFGVDVILNHHQHCFSGYEIYNNKPIFYGLGNFSFDKPGARNCSWNEGFMVQLILESTIKWEIIPYIQSDNNPTTHRLNETKESDFYSKINDINEIIMNDALLLQEYTDFVLKKKKDMYMLCFEPYFRRFLRSLYVRHLLPSVLNNEKLTFIRACLQCESHNEAITLMFKQLTK